MVIKNSTDNRYISDQELANLIEYDTVSFKDYITLIRIKWIPILLIVIAAFGISMIYALRTPNVYKSTTMVKLSKPKENILEAPLLTDLTDTKSTFVGNELEILRSFSLREKVAYALIDSLKNNKYPQYYIIFDINNIHKANALLPAFVIANRLAGLVKVEQKNDLEIINISAESTSPYEAAIIANIYAKVYYEMDLNLNRLQIVSVREFLGKQAEDKQKKLVAAENSLKIFQEKRGIVALDEQSRSLINQLTDFESKKNATKIELSMVEKNLSDYKKTLETQEPRIKDYMEKYSVEPYLVQLQKEIAQYELKRDLALSGSEKGTNDLVKNYNAKITELKEKRDKKLEIFKAGMLASSSEEVKILIQKVLEVEVKYHALLASHKELNSIVGNYESRFDALPSKTIDLARLEREKGESEKLYLLLQEKYQEAMINEQSTPGTVLIIDPARIPIAPFKPNRKMIVLSGLLVGIGLGLVFVFVRNYFDNTIQTPEDIQKLNINLLGWIPRINYSSNEERREIEFIVHKKPNSTQSEAYRALRTRLQYSKLNRDTVKTILLTSGSPQEEKTTTSINLAGSFALAGKKTLILDCDLRKSRVHKILKQIKSPGFTDCIFGSTAYNEVIRVTEIKNLYFIAAGTVPTNPAELLCSPQMVKMLERLKEDFDVVIIDSPPILTVTDAEILSRIVDATVLIAVANVTETDILKKSVELLMHEHGTFIGVLLTNFLYRKGYGNYYKNYYYYQHPSKQEKNRKYNKFIFKRVQK